MAKGEATFTRGARRLGEAVDRFLGEVPLPPSMDEPRLAATADPIAFTPAPTADGPAPAPAADPAVGPSPEPAREQTPAPAADVAAAPQARPAATTALAAARRTVNSTRTPGNGYGPATDGGTNVWDGPSNSAPSEGVSAGTAPKGTLAAWSAASGKRTTVHKR